MACRQAGFRRVATRRRRRRRGEASHRVSVESRAGWAEVGGGFPDGGKGPQGGGVGVRRAEGSRRSAEGGRGRRMEPVGLGRVARRRGEERRQSAWAVGRVATGGAVEGDGGVDVGGQRLGRRRRRRRERGRRGLPGGGESREGRWRPVGVERVRSSGGRAEGGGAAVGVGPIGRMVTEAGKGKGVWVSLWVSFKRRGGEKATGGRVLIK